MDAIIFKDNVYVYIRRKECKDENRKQKEEVVEFPDISQINTYNLYGGRVEIKLRQNIDKCEIKIDGISILKLEENLNLEDKLSPSIVCAYLNQLHQLGIDTFLANYKVAIENLKIETMNKLNESKTTNNKTLISDLNDILDKLTAILFALWMNMNAGLDNHIYTETYNNIINLYFQ